MVNPEIYTLKHNGQTLIFGKNQDTEFCEFICEWDGQGSLLFFGLKRFEQQYVLGHEDTILCRVYKNNNGQGGIIAVLEHSELLIVAYALDNLSYVEGIAHYAKTATYVRYGYDIFEDQY